MSQGWALAGAAVASAGRGVPEGGTVRGRLARMHAGHDRGGLRADAVTGNGETGVLGTHDCIPFAPRMCGRLYTKN